MQSCVILRCKYSSGLDNKVSMLFMYNFMLYGYLSSQSSNFLLSVVLIVRATILTVMTTLIALELKLLSKVIWPSIGNCFTV